MGANKVVQKSKEAKMKAAMAGGKGKKKKWSKGKVKEKLANLVMFDKATYDKMLKEIPKAKLITPSVVSERLKVNGSVALWPFATSRRRASSRASARSPPSR
ncbi:unnamed protein product [Polarella glacialis]|uniref:40S ribosomal protein S25 n=1 Tax=Polarella glacialis TaxID=89957 RepID=A0A813KH28_POLGL|nr:unnamed protein product [Polarella glacialis]CAE8704484.1 unnamed protein product [Polarella glacialis]